MVDREAEYYDAGLSDVTMPQRIPLASILAA